MRTQPKIALVLPCYNEEKVLAETSKRLTFIMQDLQQKKKISIDSFMLFVDDGSKDLTWDLIENLSIENSLVKGLKLSKNQGHQNALLAGMEYVLGKCDCLISLDADLQDDINSIYDMFEEYLAGSEIVYGVRSKRATDTYAKRLTAEMFYKLLKMLGVDIVFNHADYRLLSSRALHCFLKFEERNLFIRGIVPLIGLKNKIVYYERNERLAGESKYPLRKMLAFALDGITSFSVTPLRVISVIGFMIFLLSFFMSAYILIVALFTNKIVPGWASTVLPIYFLGGIQILAIGIVGEYIGKIYKETKRRPRYFVEKDTSNG